MIGKKWLKLFFLSFFAQIVLVFIINVIIDPNTRNTLFNFGINKIKRVADERLQKYIYLNKHNDLTGIILGSSRATYLDTNTFSKYIHGTAYNAAFGSATIDEIEAFVSYFVPKNSSIKHILLGLDSYSFDENFKSMGTMPLELVENFTFDILHISEYFSIKTLVSSVLTIRHNLKEPYVPNIFVESGMRDSEILKCGTSYECKKEYVKKNVINGNPLWHGNEISESRMKFLKKIVAVCKENNVDLRLFLGPISYLLVDKNLSKFNLYKKTLRLIASEISPVWDFTGFTDINTDPMNYLDPLHYNYETGIRIIKNIYEEDSKNTSKDSGILLDKNNIESYLNTMGKRLAATRKDIFTM